MSELRVPGMSGARDGIRRVGASFALAAGGAVTLAGIGFAIVGVSRSDTPLWLLARSAGIASFVLLFAVTALGLVLAHPHRARWTWPAMITKLRIHIALASFGLAFTVLHVLVLVFDSHAKIGILGAILPFASEYRPLPVTLGLLGMWAGLAAGLTASLAGSRAFSRVWWVLHKFAASSFALVWFHSVFAGSDTNALLWLYLSTAGVIIALALWRYTSSDPARAAASARPTTPIGARR